MMRQTGLFLLWVLVLCAPVWGVQRFPPPQFVESNHQLPQATTPAPRPAVLDWIDTGVLFAALCMASWLALKKRDRRWIAGLMIFSLLYFGFWRNGCVCPVGSVGNVAMAAVDSSYAIPVVVLAFFLLPLIFTLFFGRSFCGAVCPLGAVQDLFVIKPMRVPPALEAGLRIVAYLYLAAAVVMAVTGTTFLICRYDPFVTLFRFGGNWDGWVLAASFLAISVFVARPYCRFLCPYGVILRNLSRLSKWRVTITPDDCIRCRLCEEVCPFGAIAKPVKELPAAEYAGNKRRLTVFIILTPILAAVGGWLGWAVYPVLAKSAHITNSAGPLGMKLTLAAGIFVGLIAAAKLIGSVIHRRQEDYEARRADCLACGRCFAYCPREQIRRNEQQ
jgi:NosR/NirI family transcriptional regulator, nitrous oxide reductase regulator